MNDQETTDEVELGGKRFKRTRCEIFSRVVGYIRPVHQWNVGKKQEYADRKLLDVSKEIKED